jgi:hypothetical protein
MDKDKVCCQHSQSLGLCDHGWYVHSAPAVFFLSQSKIFQSSSNLYSLDPTCSGVPPLPQALTVLMQSNWLCFKVPPLFINQAVLIGNFKFSQPA